MEQITATFQCQNQFVDGISWRVNGTSVNLLNLPNISYESMQDGRGTVFLLSIGALLRYNQSFIECDAVLFDRPSVPPIRTQPVMLLIQGSECNLCFHFSLIPRPFPSLFEFRTCRKFVG